MGCSRESYSVRVLGLRRFVKRLRGQYVDWRLVFDDNLMPIWCWLVGHVRYNAAMIHEPPEWACKRCHRYVK